MTCAIAALALIVTLQLSHSAAIFERSVQAQPRPWLGAPHLLLPQDVTTQVELESATQWFGY
jgi:hypothetical protein